MVPRVGQKIGPYEILGRLGSGGMGLVFSAWDSRLQRDVAIKLLREEYATPGMRQRFLQEARAASRLNHPNICTIFDIGEQEGDPYLVMELLKGETIRARIARGALSPEDVLCVATEVADALIVAHGRGIIHRDIKPANIILVEKAGGRFQTKVLDFGLAKVERGDGAETRFDLTSAGTTVGTVAYMSPEQARGEPLDARSDLFSLGVVLYEMATGELPFQGATSALVFVQLLSQRPEPVRDFNPDIPKDLEKLIQTLLEKKRSDRFQSAAEVVEALHKVSLKRSGGKSLWGSKPARAWGRSDPPTLPSRKPVQDSSIESRGSSPTGSSRSAEVTSQSPSGSSETFLRPVKRIVTGESPNTPSKREANPSALSLFQAASSAAHHAAPPYAAANNPVTPTLSGTQPASSPNVSGTHPAATGGGMQRPVPFVPLSAPPTTETASSSAGTAVVQSPKSSATTPAAARASSPDVTTDTTKTSGDTLPSATASGSVISSAAGTGSSSSRIVTRVPPKRYTPPEVVWDDEADEPAATRKATGEKSGKGRAVALVTLLVIVAAGFGAWYRMTRRAVPAGDVPTSLLLVSLANRTGDSTLGGLFNSGMLLDLQQSPHLSVRGRGDASAAAKSIGETLDSGEPSLEDARRIAKAAGASNLAFGSIHMEGSSYALSMRVYDSASGARVTDSTETASSREQIGDAIDRLASDIRSGMGESGDSIGRDSVPLSREATSNLDALQAYATGDQLRSAGQIDDAMFAFERAIGVDSRFTQAYIALADIYRQQHAQVAAAAAATKAQDSSSEAGSRTQALAQASYTMNALGDYAQAISVLQQLCNNYPADLEAHIQLAVAQRLSGDYTDSLATAQGVLTMSPFQPEASGNAELDLIGLDRMDTAAQMEQQSRTAGEPHPGIAALLGSLGTPNAAPSGITDSDQIAAKEYIAAVFDGGGEFTEGLAAWRDVANHARLDPELASAASYALSEAAFDRALTSDCSTAVGLMREGSTLPAGPAASFAAGMTDALCMNLDDARKQLSNLKADAIHFTAAKTAYVPDLTAAIQWKDGDSSGALATLQAARDYDAISLSPYLRALIHLNGNQPQSVLGDLQTILLHRGATSLINPELFSLAQIVDARAYNGIGDARNSSISYKEFLNLWSSADPGSAMVAEAQSHTK